jgi:hypothetical protein
MLKYLFALTFFLGCLSAKAQIADTAVRRINKDSITLKRDSATSKPFKPKVKPEKIYHPDSTHSPRKAFFHSLIAPGWGQIYNKQYLWLPPIYVGLGLLADAIVFNQHYYSEFLKESQLRAHADTTGRIKAYAGVPDQTIYDVKDGYRRNRDLSILGFVGAWGLNAVQAYVAAKFIHSYTMDNNLGIKFTPTLLTQPVYASNINYTFTAGFKLTILLK